MRTISAHATVSEVTKQVFTKRELAACDTLPEKKRKVHLAGVLALHRALIKLYPNVSHVEVLRQHDAPPTVLVDGKATPSLQVSVSHSKGVSCAVVARGRGAIGVDIQSSEGFTLSPEQFYSPEELEREKTRSPVLIWAYKEALLKALRVGLHIHPKRLRLTLNEAGNLLGAHVDETPLFATGRQLGLVSSSIAVLVMLNNDAEEALFKTRRKS
ncbi:MAG: 4'-phosphopantetheinyl transferase superfamily protein [bacterium]|nr:4'-phosphopantetheinyl transferase superfamily protein [bacterium]